MKQRSRLRKRRKIKKGRLKETRDRKSIDLIFTTIKITI